VEVNQEVIYPVVIRPVSQQKQQAQALNQSQKAQAIGALASGVAHDFNNILTAILSHLDLVADSKELPPLLRESVHHAQNSARRGAELVSKLMTFSHRSEPKLAPLNLHKLITDMVGMLRRNIDPRIQIRVSPETPEVGWVQADESQIMQMLMYLCLNVRDAMPHGGELAIILEDVTFMGSNLSPPRRAGDFVRLTVSDTGEAMPPEVLGRLFEPYFATKILHKGVGLGLSIAYNIVIGHGGWLEVASRVGQGNQFHVYLPLTRETEKREPELAHELSEADTQALEGKEKVLVADDEELVRLVVRAVLSYRGYQIVEATNGEEAIKLYREASPPYDLVLLDVHMPNLNGWETLVRLRQLDPGVTAILLSGGLTDEENEKAVKLGAASLLPKPFDNLNLLRLVRKTLDAAQSKRTAGAA
jgi:two-component system cell cycle sensor histidine kinase/response regulator CckA